MMPRSLLSLLALAFVAACGSDKTDVTSPGQVDPKAGPLALLGTGPDSTRYTAELAVHDNLAYVTTWGGYTRGGNLGNKITIWDVSKDAPALVDSVIVPNVNTLGDVAVSDDGKLLIVATEYGGGSIMIYSLTDPRHPTFLSRYSTINTNPGVHTAEIGRVNGKLYGFLSVDPSGTANPARIVIVDLSTPSTPREVFTKVIGSPYVHDTYVRDGLLFLALWNDGIAIWDIGGGGKGGTPENPVQLSTLKTLGGEAHNIWWFHDSNGGKKYAFVGQEGPGTIGSSSVGDIHVVDVSDLTNPKEVAYYHIPGAGTHNFSVDEQKNVLYAAYYNAGVQAIDVSGDLGSCGSNLPCDISSRRIATGLTGLGKTVYTWGVWYQNGRVYASDMLGGLYVLNAAK